MNNDDQSETLQLNEKLINDEEPKLEKRRYLILLMYFLYTVSGETCFCTFSGIEGQAATYYNTDDQGVLWFPNSFLITYCVGSYFSAYFITRSFKYSYYFATFIQGVGGWVRWVAGPNLAVAILGQVLIGVGQNFGCPALILIPEKWFSKREKFAAICIASQSIFLGMGIGYILSPAIIGNNPDKIKLLNLVVAILLTVPFIICLAVVKEAPKYPPSKTAEYLASQPKDSMLTYFTNLGKLLLNWKFSLFLLIFGLSNLSWNSYLIFIGVSNCYTILSDIDYFLDPSIFPPLKVGAIGLIYVAGGSIADLIFSILIDRNRQSKYQLFNFSLKGLSLLLMITFVKQQCILILLQIFFCIFIEKMNFGVLSFVVALLGVGLQGMVPFGLEILQEIGQMDSSLISNSYIFLASLLSVAESYLVSMPSLGFYGAYCFRLLQQFQFQS